MSDEANATTDTSAPVENSKTTPATETPPDQQLAASTEAKPEGEAAKAEAKPEVPEKYEFKAPEGVDLDSELVTGFEPFAKEIGLSQEQAQKFVDFYAANILPRIEAREAAQAEQWANTVSEWAETAKKDKEYGGDQFDANLAYAARARDKFGTPELKAVLDQTGIGNHPELIRFFIRAGKSLTDDGIHTANTGGGTRSAAEVLFGNSNPK